MTSAILPAVMILLSLSVAFYFLPKEQRASLERMCAGAIRLVARAYERMKELAPHGANKPGTLFDRNQDLVSSRLSMVSEKSDYRSMEALARDCLWEIAMREGRPKLGSRFRATASPQGEDLPSEYRELNGLLLELLGARRAELLRQEREREDNEQRRQEELRHEGIVARNQDLIDKFLEITERKVSILDDYGDENWSVLPNQIVVCLRKIAEREGLRFNWEQYERGKREENLAERKIRFCGRHRHFGLTLLGPAYDTQKSGQLVADYLWLESNLELTFRRFHDEEKSKPSEDAGVLRLSGEEFENHVWKLLRSRGYDVAGTPKTSDQGADLIAKKGGKKIIVQAKHYQGPVGNKAVQEVIGAIHFYGGDEGWVITNSTFTPAAKALAQRSGVKLIDGRALWTEEEF